MPICTCSRQQKKLKSFYNKYLTYTKTTNKTTTNKI